MNLEFKPVNKEEKREPANLEEAKEVIKNLEDKYSGLKKRFNRVVGWLGAAVVLTGSLAGVESTQKENISSKLTNLKEAISIYQERGEDLDRMRAEKPAGAVYQESQNLAYAQAVADFDNADSHINSILSELGK